MSFFIWGDAELFREARSGASLRKRSAGHSFVDPFGGAPRGIDSAVKDGFGPYGVRIGKDNPVKRLIRGGNQICVGARGGKKDRMASAIEMNFHGVGMQFREELMEIAQNVSRDLAATFHPEELVSLQF